MEPFPVPLPPADLPSLERLREWQQDAPDRAHLLLPLLWEPLQTALDQDRADGFGLELGLLVVSCCLETRQFERGWAVMPALIRWNQQGVAPHRSALLQALKVRAVVRQGRSDGVMGELERAFELARDPPDALALGYAWMSMGLFRLRLGEPAQAVEDLREALRVLQHSGSREPWALVYAALAVSLRGVADVRERRRCAFEGQQLLQSQRRWGEAANLTLELIEIALAESDLDQARLLLQEARHLCAELPAAAPVRCAVQLANSSVLFAEGRHQAAIALAQEWLEAAKPHIASVDEAYFLERLAGWQAKVGQAEQALASLAASHRVSQAAQLANLDHDLRAERQRMELIHARELRARSEHHARELQHSNLQLRATLEELRDTQRQLVDAAKHAALGRMLAGMAHEINTPVGIALTAASALQATAADLLPALQENRLRRSELEATLQNVQRSGQLIQDTLTRATRLLASFRDLPTLSRSVEPALRNLGAVVHGSWQRAMLPQAQLRLDPSSAPQARLDGDALADVLLQLFQNIERHAYPAGELGEVYVGARFETPDRLRLEVRDHGSGIPLQQQALLFEPFATSQFGQGRSGLGLFVARALVEQRLGGRIQVHSPPGAGCSVILDLPARPD